MQNDPPRQFHISVAEAELSSQQEDAVAERIRDEDGTDAVVIVGCAATQCPWCGFSDHTRKSLRLCPQHPAYCGRDHAKGDKISDSWVPGTRPPHNRKQRPILTPWSVRSAPSDNGFKAKVWTDGTDALTNHVPPACTAQQMTVPAPQHGWTIDTKPIELFDHFYPVLFIVCCLLTRSHAYSPLSLTYLVCCVVFTA